MNACVDCGQRFPPRKSGQRGAPRKRCDSCNAQHDTAYAATYFQTIKADPVAYQARRDRINAYRRGNRLWDQTA